MGVHTGDSVTVAPQMTLSDEAYQELRDAAIAVIRAVGVETGGSNIQFARSRETGELRVIEMNPRVSRSSALASKATGYPIAKVAAKLAVGYTLDEIPNDLTKTTPASFEPTLDYVVVKFPRFAFEKFPGADTTLGTQMKSVGEAMGIGRTFQEAFWKAFVSRELDAGSVDALARPRRPPGRPASVVPGASSKSSRGRRTAAGAARLPPRRLVRRRGRGRLELLLLDSRRGGRAAPAGDQAARRHPRLRPEPDRAGDRVRLLLRPRRAELPRARLRGRDGQLQPRDRLDRLRHLRPALLRAARRRVGARGLRARAAGRGRDPVRRPDAAQARARDRGGRLQGARHAVRGDRPRGGPGALRDARSPSSASAARSGGSRTVRTRLSRSPSAIGYPVLVRPSYVLGGRAMRVCYDDGQVRAAMAGVTGAGARRPVPRRTRSRSTSTRSATASRSTSAR